MSQRLANIFCRNAIAHVDKPPYKRPPLVGRFSLYDDPASLTIDGEKFSPSELESAARNAPLFSMMIAASDRFVEAVDREHVRYQCLRVLLAAQAFHRDRQRFPKNLNELVPDYLDQIPIDPFDGHPLRYNLVDQGAVVYSVFHNKTDEGGKEYSFDQVSGTSKHNPDDLGLLIRTPGSLPAVAPRPPLNKQSAQ